MSIPSVNSPATTSFTHTSTAPRSDASTPGTGADDVVHGTARQPLDLLCVGLGPFGLGLACLAHPLPITTAFLDRAPGFAWHPGLMFRDATLQVPFLADLVTMADPTSPFSFLAWLKETGGLYPFYVRESFFPLRREYDDYCRWAASKARGLHWNQDVVAVHRPDPDGPWTVTSDGPDGPRTWWTRHLVVGTGSRAHLPAPLAEAPSGVVHAGEYLHHREELLHREHVSVVGSGQSAAEVVLDLLEAPGGPAIDWITRSPRFFPMEYSKLSLELTSPEYLDHFRALPEDTRDALNRAQPQLHRGISEETIARIHETLYVRHRDRDAAPVRLLAATALEHVSGERERLVLSWRNTENGHRRETLTDAVIAATGYRPDPLRWLGPVREHLLLDERGRLSPDRHHRACADGTLHVLHHGEHTHALVAPDLGMGPLRNARVLAHVMGSVPYQMEERTTFQSFGRLPQSPTVPRVPHELLDARGGLPVTAAGRSFRIRPVEVERDLPVLHAWLSAPRAAAWELVGASAETVAAEYRRMAAEPAESAWLVLEGDEPLALVETYDPACSPLAAAWPVRDGDAGLHFLAAPATTAVPGTTKALFTAALRLLWSDPAVHRVLVEPDVANTAIRALNRWAGFREVGTVELPGKTACVSVLERTASAPLTHPSHERTGHRS